MNEKIRDLMLNAISLVDNISYDIDGDIHKMYIPNVFAKTFAELIIKECVDVIKDSDAECCDEWDYAERDLVGLIQKYFGVE